MTPTLDWFAGVFESEGTVRINKATSHNQGNLCVSVVNTDLEIIEAFAARWTFGLVRHLAPIRPNHKPAAIWRTSSVKAGEFLLEIAPHIRTERVREKIRVGLEYQRQKTRGPSNRTAEYRARQVAYYETMKALNFRGVDRGR